uniref:Mpv17-like protein 2 n=1 Tax=Romanomermis culicivorax TaxID=13658 RepID=A0A915KV82_ROMCU
MSKLRSYAKWIYDKAFGQHLLLTNTMASCCMMGLGDVVQQRIEFHYGDRNFHDWRRTGRMMTMGLILGPMVHSFYGFLDRYYKVTSGRTVLRKILWDQSTASPAFSFTFITGMAVLEGKTFGEGVREFRAKFPAIYLVDWCIWPPTQAINFYFLSPKFRAIYVYFVDIIWYTFNSYIKHKYNPKYDIPVSSFGVHDSASVHK